jgi:hypothetical protein
MAVLTRSTRSHIPHKTAFFIVTAVKTSDSIALPVQPPLVIITTPSKFQPRPTQLSTFGYTYLLYIQICKVQTPGRTAS